MAWNSLSTTFAMVGFLGVVGYSVYAANADTPLDKAERMCQPIRDVRDLSYDLFNIADSDRNGKRSIFAKLDNYLHTDICSDYGVKYFWGEQTSKLYDAYDHFREELYKYHLSKKEITFVMQKGKSLGVNWMSKQDTDSFLNEYMQYKNSGGVPK